MRVMGVALLALTVACSGDPVAPANPASPGQLALIQQPLAALGYAVAISGSGRGPFDNHLACARRGVAHYYDVAAGRQANFYGCQIAPGVSVSGSAQITWNGAHLGMSGNLTINFADTAAAGITTFAASTIDSAAYHAIVDTAGFTLGTIPNPSLSLASLTDDDLARLAHHLGMRLGFLLLDETIEAGRGNHDHTMACGTTAVTIDAQTLPHLANDWTGCNDGGVIIAGDFTMAWGQFDIANNRLGTIRMDLDGAFELGGGLPRVALSRLRWTLAGNGNSLPGTFTLRVEVTGGGTTRAWQRQVYLDD